VSINTTEPITSHPPAVVALAAALAQIAALTEAVVRVAEAIEDAAGLTVTSGLEEEEGGG
jgi:hypothetical protein